MSDRPKHVLIATGGTGGHVFPAQALGRQLLEKQHKVLFMGKGLNTNPYFSKEAFESVSIDAATPFRRGILRKLISIASLGKGVYQASRSLKAFRPDLVVGFGSFHSFPVLAAAFLQRIPIALFESNSVPGKVNRLFSRCCLFCGVQFPKAQEYLKGPCHEVTMPCWAQRQHDVTKESSLKHFGLTPDVFTVLVFGGSQGAAFINPIIANTLKTHHKTKTLQVIHMTGNEAAASKISKEYQEAGILAYVRPFEKNMHLAWMAADVAVCRAGAATLSEAIEFEVPCVLIPYPAATDDHQLKNAMFVGEEIKGGIYLEEKKLSLDALLPLLETSRWEEMRSAIQDFKSRKQKKQLIELVQDWLTKE